MLFYFTATGNSLYIAKNIEKHPLSIPQELKKKDLIYHDDMIGIVAPVYAGELPKTVIRFLKQAHFDTNYFYILLTYGKNETIAPSWCQSLCQDLGIHVHYIQPILMVDNYLPAFDMEEEVLLDKQVEQQLSIALQHIQQRLSFIPKATQTQQKMYKRASFNFKNHPEEINGEAIVMSDRCAGCRICEQVCPIGNIKVFEGKAQRINKTCDFCLACVHHCPFKAIELKIDKNPQARYRNPCISLKEIVQSNKQGGRKNESLSD